MIHITCSKLHPLVTEHSLAVAVGYQAMILPGSVPKYEFPASTKYTFLLLLELTYLSLKQAAPEVLYIHDDEQVDPICEKLISEGCLDSPSNILVYDTKQNTVISLVLTVYRVWTANFVDLRLQLFN